MKILLYLLSKIYSFLASLRRFLYESGILKQKELPRPVISIGNLSVGGTGKTPTTIFTAKKLQEKGYRVCVLSRGYKRKKDELVLAERPDETTYEDIGDEPYLILRRGIPVAVYRDRYLAGIEALNRFNPDIFILDDGFQHFQLYRDIDILLVDSTKPFWEDKPLPLGRLREPSTFYIYADCFVVTRFSLLNDKDSFIKNIKHFKKPFFIAYERIDKIVDTEGKIHELGFLSGKRVVVFAGLGNNNQFFETVKKISKQHGFLIEEFLSFPDHYDYKDFTFDEKKIYLTTEKDIIKIKHKNVYALIYDLELDNEYINFILKRIFPKLNERERDGKQLRKTSL